METSIISGIILGFCAMIMIIIGITQCRSAEPVGFYTGKTPPAKEEIRDVSAWNRKHGIMWILYGVCFVIIWILGLFIRDLWFLPVFFAGTVLPVFVMIAVHRRLVRDYTVKQ